MKDRQSPRFVSSLAVLFACLLCATAAHAQWTAMNPVRKVQQEADGVVFTLGTGTLKVQVCSDAVIRVLYSPTATFPKREDYVVIKQTWPAAQWTMQSTDDTVTLTTTLLRVTVTRKDSAITYAEVQGESLVREASRKLTPEKANGEDTYRAESQVDVYGSHEALYGLGQHQAGVWNYRGESVDISQENSNISVPLMLSSKGYGIFWNNTSRSRFNNRFANYLYISSEVADVIDYYFLYGPDFDKIIASYRDLTGQAPMFGKWAYGFWQCKNRYKSQDEILGVARKYRELHIPVDNIVQDWFWWNRKGEFVFNKNYPDPKAMLDQLHGENIHLMISIWPFFEPGSANYDYMQSKGWFVDKFKYAKPPYHTDGMAVYDATSPEARKFYWDEVNKGLFSIGLDAWWMDTTEPETEGQEENILLNHKLAAGSGNRYVNAFPLLDTQAVYRGQRSASDRKRVFILSRSAFAGSQRNGVTAWSGDINSDWLSFRRQVPAGLNFALSGIPYWTTDIGGFVSGSPVDPAFRELFIRWFQYGTFNPILRVHGTRRPDENELWSYGPDAQTILVNFDRLRYRMLPYIYSLAWKTTSDAYTPMRPLAMDFRTDVRAQNTGDQFMYGPAFLVNPVTDPGATTRQVYLPGAKWYDFWTGSSVEGGRTINAITPLDRLPLYVRAGSILPLGPDEEWSTEKAADPIELRIYRGASGDFTLYEDENDNYDYEKGVYATIALHWDDAAHALTIGDRKGEFPGMLESRTFRIVFVSENHGVGVSPADEADKVVQYSGKQITVTP
ncbi:MAG TPA: TIM-barrel domain-containing protein [Candidatus Sulfotelmatobacter sp.]|nr:TIM-barrel domain-containing protein [Candidatus Sulfotelmatobacter sp.]